ncbi:MAG: DUF1700 domain-containing protein [Bacteroidales bacterium]|nr:DUF1700 domain-containing protein [Bacteroidales bacterium]
MKRIDFKNTSAQKIYNDYFKRIERCSTVLSKEDRTDLIMEFNSHIYEGLQKNTGEDELEGLLNILENLGMPEEVLKPLIADKKLRQATKTFNPKHVFQAIKLNIKNGIVFGFFGLLYLFLFSTIFLFIAKIVFPNNTGLFYNNNEFQSFGFVADYKGYNEVLGIWFIPLVLIFTIILYLTITLLLRIWRKK